jgi:outer membrane protein, heavy metal efflux system
LLSRIELLAVALLIAGLSGCASVPEDWGRSDVAQYAADRGHPLPTAANATEITDTVLKSPLSADTAVQLALINNPRVRAEGARLGIAAAGVYEAGRLANPVISASRLYPVTNAEGQSAQSTLGIAINFVNLLFLPANQRFADAQFEATKLAVAASVVGLATEVESAWYAALGADQLAQMRELAERLQRASAELAQRYFDAGNISLRDLAMEQAAASQAALVATTARARAVEARSTLNRLMGLTAGQGHWTFAQKLAEPLPNEDSVADLQELAVRNRLDVASLRRNAQALADRYGLTRHTRLVNGIEIGAIRERDFDRAIHVGPTLSLELPLFNWGSGRVAAARAALDQAEAELDARVLDVSNEVELAAAKVQAASGLSTLYKTALVPQRETVVTEAQKEQNYMLIGVFDLILAKQQAFDAYAGYIEAVRDYWIARSGLSRAVGRRLPSSDQPTNSTFDPADLVKPQPADAQHIHPSVDGMPDDMSGMKMDHLQHMTLPSEAGLAAARPPAGHPMEMMPDIDISNMPSIAQPTAPKVSEAGHQD